MKLPTRSGKWVRIGHSTGKFLYEKRFGRTFEDFLNSVKGNEIRDEYGELYKFDYYDIREKLAHTWDSLNQHPEFLCDYE